MITNLRLQHFRSYSDASFEFGARVNIIVGPNASGKTNLLEAIEVVCRGQSFRVKDNELVEFGEPWSRLDASLDLEDRTVKLEVVDTETVRKSFVIDEVVLKRLLLNRTVPMVLFEPSHLNLLTGSPDLRRGYLDGLLEQTVQGYGSLLKQYRRTLAQRNALLKRGHHTGVTTQLFAWNIRLSELGSQIAIRRTDVIETINASLAGVYSGLAGKTAHHVRLGYQSKCSLATYASDLLHNLERSQDRDMALGFTTYGPHRDDIALALNGHPLQAAASRGETRTLLLSLKVLELQLLEQARQKRPLLLLDDVFSELDGTRRRALVEFVDGYQTFITTTDADLVVQNFMDESTIIPLG
jgi:DNA replication and repair protein RecF